MTEAIMGAQNFNFAPNFPQMGFSAPNFAFLEKNVRTRRLPNNFPTAQNLGRNRLPPLP